MNSFYAYDTAGDHMEDDCAELGPIEAASFDEAVAMAAAIWPNTSIRVAAV